MIQLEIGLRVDDLRRFRCPYLRLCSCGILFPDLDIAYALRQAEDSPNACERENVAWARIFSSLDPDEYEITSEEFE